MSGHHPFSELIKDFSPERRRLLALGSQRLEIKIRIAETHRPKAVAGKR